MEQGAESRGPVSPRLAPPWRTEAFSDGTGRRACRAGGAASCSAGGGCDCESGRFWGIRWEIRWEVRC